MPMFRILPTDHASSFAGITTPSAAGVLGIIAGLSCKEADVLRDGEYRMTIRLGDNGLWSIFERDFHLEDEDGFVPAG